MNFILSQPFPTSLLPAHSQLIPLLISTRSRRVSSPFVFIATLTNALVQRNSAEPFEITWNGEGVKGETEEAAFVWPEKSPRGEERTGLEMQKAAEEESHALLAPVRKKGNLGFV